MVGFGASVFVGDSGRGVGLGLSVGVRVSVGNGVRDGVFVLVLAISKFV